MLYPLAAKTLLPMKTACGSEGTLQASISLRTYSYAGFELHTQLKEFCFSKGNLLPNAICQNILQET